MAGIEAAGEVEGVSVRACHELRELEMCVALQKDVWGFSDAEMVPLHLFVVAPKIGGQVIGAFRQGEMIGFALSVPGTRAGRPYLHSHLLAVAAAYRNAGVGRRIKLFQREDAVARGIGLIEWTFDPLEIKNCWLNLEKLGAIARRYNMNQYGSSTSPLHGGLPTDRLVAEWWLRSSRVETLLRTGARAEFKVEQEVVVPAEINDWKAAPDQRPKAADLQARNAQLLQDAFRRGLAALGYARDEHGNGQFLLGRWDEELKL
jgi:predicted GNAT superfamily acetyltransferase